jgi:CRP-like cAMP-binding protein
MPEPAELRPNKLLAAPPTPLLEQISPGLPILQAERGQVLYRPGELMDKVTFPLSGLFSLVITDPAGSFTSIATVGREGAIELAPARGSIPAPTEIVCLINGRAVQVPASDLRELLNTTPVFQTAISRYMGARFVDCVQVSACHRLHTLEARVARCLPTTRDSITLDEFSCTRELLTGMLGSSHPKVSLALETLTGRAP